MKYRIKQKEPSMKRNILTTAGFSLVALVLGFVGGVKAEETEHFKSKGTIVSEDVVFDSGDFKVLDNVITANYEINYKNGLRDAEEAIKANPSGYGINTTHSTGTCIAQSEGANVRVSAYADGKHTYIIVASAHSYDNINASGSGTRIGGYFSGHSSNSFVDGHYVYVYNGTGTISASITGWGCVSISRLD